MATILREHTRFEPYRRYYHQIEPARSALTFFPTLPPFVQKAEALQRVEPRKWAQDFQQPNFQTQGIPGTARAALIFRGPTYVHQGRRYYHQVEQTPSLLLKTLIPAGPVPFTLTQFPEIYRRNIGDMLGIEAQSFLDGPALLPFTPADMPIPMRAKATPQDFLQAGGLAVPAPKPFAQNDWPIPLKRRDYHQDFTWPGTTTRGIPTGLNEPFSQKDWSVPLRAKSAQADSYTSPEILLITPVARPFSQADFPIPYGFRRLREDWIWPGTTTRGIIPVPPVGGSLDSVHLEAYWIDLSSVLLRWSASLGASGYRLYMNGEPQPAVITLRFTVVSGLAIDTPYVFNIVAVNSAGVDSSILSNPVYFEHGSNEIGTYHTRPWN